MARKFVLFTIALIAASVAYKIKAFDSPALIAPVWILAGLFFSALFCLGLPSIQRRESRFKIVFAVMLTGIFVGFGFFGKAWYKKEKWVEIQTFPKVEAQLVSCRVGEIPRGRYGKRVHQTPYFPIWTYQYRLTGESQLITSDSNSMSDFNDSKRFNTSEEAQEACQIWAKEQTRDIIYDPQSPEKSLVQLPERSPRIFVEIFVGTVILGCFGAGLIAVFNVQPREET